jgi:hypothetical protein
MFLSPINGLHGSAYARCYKYFVPNGTFFSLLVVRYSLAGWRLSICLILR